jgi:hypothetical protein
MKMALKHVPAPPTMARPRPSSRSLVIWIMVSDPGTMSHLVGSAAHFRLEMAPANEGGASCTGFLTTTAGDTGAVPWLFVEFNEAFEAAFDWTSQLELEDFSSSLIGGIIKGLFREDLLTTVWGTTSLFVRSTLPTSSSLSGACRCNVDSVFVTMIRTSPRAFFSIVAALS